MKYHFQFIALELGELIVGSGFQRIFGTDVHALRAIDALIEIECRLELLVADLGDGNGVGRAIPHAQLAPDAFDRLELDFTPEPVGHPHLDIRIENRGRRAK